MFFQRPSDVRISLFVDKSMGVKTFHFSTYKLIDVSNNCSYSVKIFNECFLLLGD
jgi:hypothetical protein